MKKVLGDLRYFKRGASKSDWIGLGVGTSLFAGGILLSYVSNWWLLLSVVGATIPIVKYIPS